MHCFLTMLPGEGIFERGPVGQISRTCLTQEGRSDGGMDGAEEVKQRTVQVRNGCELLTNQLNNDFELTDLNLDNDDLAEGFALPGEVVEDTPSYTPSFCRNTELELSTRPHLEPCPLLPCPSSPRLAIQAETEEVQPFCLDLSFDYDHVTLSCKHRAP